MTNQNDQILHITSRPSFDNIWKVTMFYVKYATSIDNDCEGLFYISLKYRRDKDIIYTLYVFISIYSFYTLN